MDENGTPNQNPQQTPARETQTGSHTPGVLHAPAQHQFRLGAELDARHGRVGMLDRIDVLRCMRCRGLSDAQVSTVLLSPQLPDDSELEVRL